MDTYKTSQKMYRNNLATFLAYKYSDSKNQITTQRQWVSLNSEAIVIENKGGQLIIQLKDSSEYLALSKIEFVAHFSLELPLTSDDLFEFNSKSNKLKKDDIVRLVKKHILEPEKSLFLDAIDKAYTDAYIAAGSAPFTVEDYDNHKANNFSVNTLSSIGNPYFNRKPRWAPVADPDSHNMNRSSHPAPTGIRASDYASLKDCNDIYLELLCQLFSMVYSSDLPQEIVDYLSGKPVKSTHRCHYCGELMDLDLFLGQAYKSKEHAINFCHMDPDEKANSTRPGNVYFGHTSCNRKQGGFSEKERILDGLRLLDLHRQQYMNDNTIQEALKLLL
jgi:hypothetical protein